MATVVTITSGKGGVGKTTTTANLGAALALLGQKTVVLMATSGSQPGHRDGAENRIVYDVVDYIEGRCKLRQAFIRDKRAANCICSPPRKRATNLLSAHSKCIQVCDELKAEFDIILIDSPAGIEQGFKNALAPADRVLVVINPEVSSVRDADRVIGIVESQGKGPAQLIINRLVPARVKPPGNVKRR